MVTFSKPLLEQTKQVLSLARSKGVMISTAESCTGGLISAAFTEIPGSSSVFDRAFVTYSNAAKQDMLGVTAESLERFGAVSSAVAKEMAHGAIARSQASLAVSVTGIAGPDGGSDEKPVGTVWFGIAELGGAVTSHHKVFDGLDRTGVREATVETAMNLLYETLS